MSLVTLIRDYVDVALDGGAEQLNGYTLAYHVAGFLFTVVKEAVLYCFTFRWLRDLSYFCLTPPSLISSFINGGVNFVDKGVEVSQWDSHLLAFSESNSSAGIGVLFLGFFNGCFSCMHLSAAHVVTVRRMLVQGVPAGFCSALGTALGQCCFLTCVLFGFRGLLLPWLALEPLGYVFGTVILLCIASAMAQDRRTPTLQWSDRSSLLSFASTSAALAWCEQTALFQWVANMSLGAEPTFLEIVPTNQPLEQLVRNSSYLLTFFLGTLIGGCIIGLFLQRLLEFLLRRSGIAVYYGLVKQANLPLATLAFAFGFGSMPYYGFDYLITKGFGFVPHEKVFQQTLFSPINLQSKTSQGKEPSQGRLEDQLALLFTLEGEKSKSLAIDTTPFDNGQYLKRNQKRPQTFEDLNYRGEHLWTNRLARISNTKEQANQTQSSFLGPVFTWMRSFLWGDVAIKGSGNINDRVDAGDSVIEDVRSESKGGSSQENDPDNTPFGINGFGERTSFINDVDHQPHNESRSGQRSEGDDQFNSSDQQLSNLFQLHRPSSLSLPLEAEQMDNYVKEFDRQFDRGFSTFYDADPPSLIDVDDQWQEKRIKEKCYTNPIYKFLLNAEIDSFLARQPHSHWLSPQEEILLLQRRELLGKYYDTLALTSQVATSESLDQLVPKSYADRPYNHQFKGTLKVARRLFSIKANQPLNDKMRNQQVDSLGGKVNSHDQSKVVKFDQPLFSKEKDNAKENLFHEELFSRDGDPSDASPFIDGVNNGVDPQEMQTPETPDEYLSDHLDNEKKDLKNIKETFSLEQAEPTPLYAGWDEELRKLVLTNRFQNRAVAGYMSPDFRKNGESSSTGSTAFTSWPLPDPLLKNKRIDSSNDFTSDGLTSGDQRMMPFDLHDSPSESTKGISEVDPREEKKETVVRKNFEYKNRFLFQGEPVTNEMVNTLVQWQKLVSNPENKQLVKEDKNFAKQKLTHWPENIRRASWANEPADVDDDTELETSAISTELSPLKRKTLLWEFTPPDHGGFIWPGSNWKK